MRINAHIRNKFLLNSLRIVYKRRIYEMKNFFKITGIIVLITALTANCDKERGFIIMPISQEIAMGSSLDSAIKSDAGNYPILSEKDYPEVYAFLNSMMSDVLTNDNEPLKYKDRFEWQITVINQDVLNAFAAPGGKLYFYTGLLKYLDNSAELAGVLGHEMAHADLRHSARQMQKDYGLNIAAGIIFGSDPSALEEILIGVGTGAAGLKFSRDDEYQADEYAVRYLAGTSYDARGGAGFFEQLIEEGNDTQTWEALSTHPNSQDRVDKIYEIWEGLGSPAGSTFDTEYAAFQALLP